MIGFQPNCIGDFLFSNAADRAKLVSILSRKYPHPFAGKSGILFHGTWGTGKSTLSNLMPELLETAHEGNWNFANGVDLMPASNNNHTMIDLFRCGNGVSITSVAQRITKLNDSMPFWHFSSHHYFVFDEVDRLTTAAQQSLRPLMDMERCMFFFTTNYLNKIDPGIVNRCHLIEMNQVTVPNAYVTLGHSVLQNMGLSVSAVPVPVIEDVAKQAKGSLRTFITELSVAGLEVGGVMP